MSYNTELHRQCQAIDELLARAEAVRDPIIDDWIEAAKTAWTHFCSIAIIICARADRATEDQEAQPTKPRKNRQ